MTKSPRPPCLLGGGPNAGNAPASAVLGSPHEHAPPRTAPHTGRADCQRCELGERDDTTGSSCLILRSRCPSAILLSWRTIPSV